MSPDEILREAAAFREFVGQQSIISITDTSGTIIDCNEKFTQISGYSHAELLGQDHRIVNSGYHPKLFWVEMWETVARGESWHSEVCNRAKNGDLYWVDTIIAPFVDADGKIEKFVSMRTDITERKLAEERLRWSELQLNEAQRIAKIGSWSYKINEDILEWSDAVYTIFEVQKDNFEPTYDTYIELVHPDDRERINKEFRESLELKTPYSTSYRLLVGTSDIKYIHERCETGYDSQGKPIRSLGTVQDITHIKQSQIALEEARDRAEAASRAKSEFLANMSHEIRTPMTAILGFADILGDGNVIKHEPELIAESIKTIRTNANHLLSLINDILDMSKLEAGKMAIEHITTSPIQIVHEVFSLLNPRATAKGIELTLEFESALPKSIDSDPTRFRQIILNLVSNAIKFTEQGTVSLRVLFESANNTIQCTIADTGIGMTPEQLESITHFKAFNQGDSSMTRRYGGTGLGLRISNKLAELLGGSIQARSTLGAGSTFSFTLPAGILIGVEMIEPDAFTYESEPIASDALVQDSMSSSMQLQGVRILLAEDGLDNQRLVSFHLQKEGADVTVADNGLIAFEKTIAASQTESPFDLILMDMQMPELDGYDATKKLRAKGQALSIVALTAHAMAGDREKCLAAGCDDYITKPIDRRKLIEMCAKWHASCSNQAAA